MEHIKEQPKRIKKKNKARKKRYLIASISIVMAVIFSVVGAGLIYAMNNGFDAQQTIEYAAAASCLKQTIELDVNLSKPADVLALVGGDGSGRVQR